MSPTPTGPVVARPDLYDALFDGVTRDDAGPTTLTTAIEGAGGFGKTTLAVLLCHDPRVAEHFTGGLLWVTVGERSHGARLAELISGLCEVLSGDVVKTTDPQAAGGRLGELLDARGPILLVVDDVWRPEQLAPLMIGGRSCRRLITTRNARVAPRRGVSVLVDEMTTEQAIATLTDGVGEVPRDLLARLVAATGRWPLLLSLVNAALTDQIAAGAGVPQAVRWVLRRLETGGPAAFDTDLGDEDGRSHAVKATMDASLALLAPHERERYLDLAVVPEDTHLPAELLSRLWRTSGDLAASEAEKLRARLVRLRLVLPGWEGDTPAVRLHDILGSYLRHRLTDEELAFRHELTVQAAAGLLPTPEPESPWWSLPSDALYLWHHLPHHLACSGRSEEHEALVCDLRWVAAKIANLGSSVPVEIDLAEVPTGTAQSLRRALGSMTELLTPGDPPTALDATLYCYLSGVPALEPVVAAYRHHLSSPQLVPAWPLPDQPGLVILRTLTGHGNGVSHCAFSPDGALVATASHDRTARVWDTTTGRTVKILSGHAGAVSACAFSPDGTLLATAGHDLTARVWDVATGKEREVLTGHSEPVTSCAFSPDGTLLATTSHDNTIRLWDLMTTRRVRVLTGHTAPVLTCAFSPDGTLLATAGHDLTARVWDVATGEEQEALTGHSESVTSCAFSPDGTLLATTSHDNTIRLWDLMTTRRVRVLTGHTAPVLTCAFSPDGTLLATAGHDLTARVWDVATGEEQEALTGHSESVTSCAFSPDGTLLATTSHDWKLQFWQTGAGSERSEHSLRWQYTCAFSPDGTVVATAGHDRTVRVWDVLTGDLRQTFEGHTDTVSGCAFSPDGMLLATASHDHTIRLWDTFTGTTRTVLTGHTEAVADCDFSPDGTLLASASHDDTVRLWDMATGRPLRTLTGHTGAVSTCAFSPDGTLLATASHDHTIRLWDTSTGTTRTVLTGHTNLVSACAFSPDGTLLATAGHDRTSKVWDVASGRLRQTLARHTSGVTDCAFSPDGTLVTTDIGERRLRMWHPGSDRPWCGLRVVTPLLHLAWHPDQPLLCAVGETGVYLFRYLPHGVRDATT
ncbi:NB-ARC domain-containing protein [Streptosporangium sp. NPDC006013]|uniref:NB-ARC domain-containing protein n=1 Tax=Streptosporangium sp. NPDC006013 TaxID=3155596 RepID=UPI0033A599C5